MFSPHLAQLGSWIALPVIGGNGGKSIKPPTARRAARTIDVPRTRIESQGRQQLREPRVRSAPAIGRGEAAAIRGPLMGLGCNPSASAPQYVGLASVVVAHLNDDEAVPVDRVDEAILVGDSPRPDRRSACRQRIRSSVDAPS